MSCRALVLVGVVALVASFYQSTPCSAVTTGPTSRQRVKPVPSPLNSMHQAALFGDFLFESPPPMRRAVLGSVTLHAYLLANRSYSEVATKTVTSWSNALDEPALFNIDAPNDDQCELFDVGAPSYDQRGSFDAPNDLKCALKESVVALPVRRHLAFESSP